MKKFSLLAAILIISLLPATALASLPLDYFRLFNEHGSIMLVIDVATGDIEFSNVAAQNFYGFPQVVLESMTIQQINTMTPEEVAAERALAAAQKRNHFIFQHRLANGEYRTVEVFSYPFLAEGRPMLYSIINDITPAILLAEEQARLRSYYQGLLWFFVAIFALLSARLYRLVVKSRKEQALLGESERKHATLVANIPGMVYRCNFDEHWTMQYVSDGCGQITGYEPQALLNNAVVSFESLIDHPFRAYLRERWTMVIEQGTVFDEEYLIITKDGTKKWVAERGQIVYGARGRVEAIEGIITDVDRLKANEEKIREYYEKLHATLISVGDGVITTDRDSKIELMNPIAQSITGWSQEEAVGLDFKTVFRIINEYTRETTKCPVEEVFATKTIVELANHTLLIAQDGRETPIEDTAAPIHNASGQMVGSVVVFRDSTEKHAKKKEIEYLSYHDHLTGLYNRRFFEEELRRLDSERNYPITIMLIDVNGLKLFNDAFGHAVGDEVIKKVASSLREECRSDEIVARYGGDEFVILLPKTDVSEAEKLARRLKQSIEQQKVWNLDLSVSIGWDAKTNADSSFSQVISDAETYMYQKKIVEHQSKRSLVIKSILNALLVKSPSEEEHAQRVSQYCEQIGSAYGLSYDQVKTLASAGELHDIGKIATDKHVLDKVSQLTGDEWREIKKHPETGYRILSTASEFANLADAIIAHHERWDGNGYPKGLQGEGVPFMARVIAVADAFDAMTSDRPYRPAMSMQEAAIEMNKYAGTQFDPEIVQVFLTKVLGLTAPLYKPPVQE
ncbi:MAG: putative diguanylate cyclase YegE [Firmicutes bacterium]|nr:putative diguanylate cyclase YegE [Bacillota bacterium]